jgi:predicted metal-dependent hydrolase
MARRPAFVPGVGEVILSKRRKAKYLRVSIKPNGEVLVSLPQWVPYAAAIAFAQQRAPWIKKQVEINRLPLLADNSRIGKAHTLVFREASGSTKARARVTNTTIEITSAEDFDEPSVQKIALAASEKALKMEANKLLPQRLRQLAEKHEFDYHGLNIRKLTARWGSCSSSGVITLSYFLIQLPWEFIDYVILHELTHTKYLNHGRNFWVEFNKALPDARNLQKQIKSYKPRVESL